jgi:FAD/FMN-containing dehydrogenase
MVGAPSKRNAFIAHLFWISPMPLTPAETAAALAGIVGDDNVVSDTTKMGAWLNEPRKRFHQTAVAVVTPPDVAAVQAVLRWANENRVGIIAQGGNTGLVGAQVPLLGTEVILSLQELDRIRAIDTAAGVMTAEAGVILENAHKAAEAEGAMFPLWLASQGSARIGGVLSSNAGGVNVLAYGNARELTMGVEAVLADGRLYNGLNALKKDNTGYDLKDLLVGAEGTLGIITAATLKLYPLPEDYETALVNVASPEAALDLFQLMRQRAGSRLNAFELIPQIGLDIQLRHGMLDADPTASASPWYALIELTRMAGTAPGSLQSALEAAFEEELIADAVIAESLADRTRMWAFREQMSECQSREGASIKHDVSVPIAAVPALIAEGIAAAERLVPGIRPVPFGHMGDGNIHFNFSMPVGADPKAFMAQYDEAMHEVIYEVALKLGGSVSAEHGIGQLKTDLLKQVKDPVALDMMRAIKTALDPNGILNPGKLLRM